MQVNDGAGPLNGSDTFTRTFDGLPPINEEAAKRIETLEDQLNVTIGALRIASEKSVQLARLLRCAKERWSFAAVESNHDLWVEILEALEHDEDPWDE